MELIPANLRAAQHLDRQTNQDTFDSVDLHWSPALHHCRAVRAGGAAINAHTLAMRLIEFLPYHHLLARSSNLNSLAVPCAHAKSVLLFLMQLILRGAAAGGTLASLITISAALYHAQLLAEAALPVINYGQRKYENDLNFDLFP